MELTPRPGAAVTAAGGGGGGSGTGSSGGAGSIDAGGNGGSGIVIVRYQGASLGNIGGTETSGNGDLTYNGPGRLTLGAANTFTGTARVTAGTLAAGLASAVAPASSLTIDSGATFDRGGFSQTVSNAVINGSVDNTNGGGLLTVNGTLSGSGVVNGAVLVNGVHSPGNSPGIQTFNANLTYGSAAVINWERRHRRLVGPPAVAPRLTGGCRQRRNPPPWIRPGSCRLRRILTAIAVTE
jgi:autotransporter-associated beta strand protein